ncbi:MAG TPA: glycosyltransferase family 39 protein [bacterium]|nr:glycosyltransferase family 39 protein [bacterium]
MTTDCRTNSQSLNFAGHSTNEQMDPHLSWLEYTASTHPYLRLLILAGLLYLPWLNAEPLRSEIEGNRMLVAREMLQNGDWVVPTLNGGPYLYKPPLTSWVICLFSYPCGDVTVWTGRLPSVLSVLALVCLVAWWGRRELDARTGFLAAVIAASSGLVFEKGTRAEVEALLMLTTTGSLIGFWYAIREKGRRKVGAVLLGGVSLGAAILVKGPVAPVMFAVTAAVMLVVGGQSRVSIFLVTLCMAGIATLVVLPWVVLLSCRVGFGELLKIVEGQVVRRVQSATKTNVEPFWFYPPALLGGLLPWSFLIPGLWAIRNPNHLPNTDKRAQWFLLMAWSVGTLILFSFSSGKENRYLISTYPAWALLLAWGWLAHQDPEWLKKYRALLGNLVGWGTWFLPFLAAVAVFFIRPQAWFWGVGAGAILLIARLAAAWGQRIRKKELLFAALLLGVFGAKMYWAEVYQSRQADLYPIAAFGQEIADHLRPDERLIAVNWYHSYIQFFVKHPFDLFENPKTFRNEIATGRLRDRYVLVLADDLPQGAEGSLTVVFEKKIGRSVYRLLYIPKEVSELPSIRKSR